MFNKLKILKKMKIKNLIAVAALLMGSTSAFAGLGLGQNFAYNGLVYQASAIDAEKLTAEAVVYGVSDNANGQKLIANEMATVIEAEFTVNIDKEDWTITVTGIDGNFATNGEDPSTIEALSIDETNFAAVYDDFSGDFPGLTSLTIVDNEETPLLTAIPTLADYTILEVLDIEKCLGITEVTAPGFKALTKVVLPETIDTIDDDAFNGCTDLATVNFPDALIEIGMRAFKETAITAADLTKTEITEIKAGAFRGTALTAFIVPKAVTKIGNNAFYECKSLATVTFEAESECIAIGERAFGWTAISEIKIPEVIKVLKKGVFSYTNLTSFKLISSGDPATPAIVDESAFEGCVKLKTFNFVAADMQVIGDDIDVNAFIGCRYPVTIYAPQQEFIDLYPGAWPEEAPYNCVFEAKETVREDGTIEFKDGFAKWYNNLIPIAVDASKYKAFSVYVDNGGKKKDGTAYFQGLKINDGRYYIPAGHHVIFQSLDDETKAVSYEDRTVRYLAGYPDDDCVLIDEIFTFDGDYTLAQFQTGDKNGIGYDLTLGPVPVLWQPQQYLYRLTNHYGIGFRQFGSVKMKGGWNDGTDDTCADAQFFIQSLRVPDAEGRLNVVWLDEDGNVIDGEATAIKGVKAAAENGAIYNIAGQKVAASYKGIVIKDGKKYIQK